MPRVTAGLALHDSSGEVLSGVSAFAFQGTNAHALLQRPHEASTGGTLPYPTCPAAVPWQREAQWVAPMVHLMLHRVRCSAAGSSKAMAHIDCQLSSTPRLAFFWDHSVGGRVLFPGAGFF